MNIIRFFDAVYWDNRLRLGSQRRSWRRDLLLYAKNRALRPRETRLVRRYFRDDLPTVFIVGVPRSGTTLLFQLMARHLEVGYVNNFMARYWMAPVYAARKFERVYPDCRWREDPESDFGAAEGLMEPHEFSWFWQFWLEFGATDHLTREEWDAIDWEPPRAEILALAGWFARPVVFKSINYTNYHIAWLHELFPKARFIWMRRDPRYTAQSILGVRESRYGDRKRWWSVRPRDVEVWRHRPPEEQVAHQVHDIETAIEGAFAQLPARAGFTVSYEALTADPRRELAALATFLETPLRDGTALETLSLAHRNHRSLPEADWTALTAALERGQ